MRKSLVLLMCAVLFVSPLAGSAGRAESKDDNIKFNLKTSQIPFRDICVLADPATNMYYMVGFIKNAGSAQEVACYRSKDLENWGGYVTAMYNDGEWDQNWAPEIHLYKGEYYLFANLKGRTVDGDLRGCYILKSDAAKGVYEKYSSRITPEKWECLDGTLYVEDDIPYMVYCREWTRTIDENGEMYYVRLQDDLSGVYPDAEHVRLFAAKDHPASTDGITDGPYLYNAKNGDLIMIWSKYINGKYCIITSRSKSGKIGGEWIHDPEPLFTNDGGHAMIFTDFDGQLRIAFHERSTDKGNEIPVIYKLNDDNGVLSIQTDE